MTTLWPRTSRRIVAKGVEEKSTARGTQSTLRGISHLSAGQDRSSVDTHVEQFRRSSLSIDVQTDVSKL